MKAPVTEWSDQKMFSVSEFAASLNDRIPDKRSPPTDPVVGLFRRYRRLWAESEPIDARADELYEMMEARYGIPVNKVIQDAWSQDPFHSELMHVNSESDRFANEIGDTTDEMLATPATSPAGAAAKLKVALDMWWPADASKEDFHVRATLGFVADALRAIGGDALPTG